MWKTGDWRSELRWQANTGYRCFSVAEKLNHDAISLQCSVGLLTDERSKVIRAIDESFNMTRNGKNPKTGVDS
jgi:hypothetical protein